MKKSILFIVMTTLLATQAYGVALCPSICKTLNDETMGSSVPPCHQEPQSKEPINQEMPLDCNIMVFIDSLSTFNMVSQIFNFLDFEIEKSCPFVNSHFLIKDFLQSKSASVPRGKSPPAAIRPVYLLISSFLI